MGSESQKKIGMSRGVDTTRCDPNNLFIVGLDGEGDNEQARIDWVCGLFPSLSEQIRAERDPRSVTEIPEWFRAAFNPADADPIKYVNLGAVFPTEGCGRWSGKPLLVVNDGRQRTKTFRLLNEERQREGGEPLEILCLQRKFKTSLAAAEAKARGNVRVPQTPMQRAWLAQEFVDAGMPLDKIAPLVGVSTDQAVRNLLVLVDCSPAVQAAVDAGPDDGGITQSAAVALAKRKDHAAQDAELQARLSNASGKTGRERSKALRGESSSNDVKRPVQAKVLGKVAEHLATADRSEMTDAHRVDEWLAIVRWALGDDAGFDALPDDFRAAVHAAQKKPEKSAEAKPASPEAEKQEAA